MLAGVAACADWTGAAAATGEDGTGLVEGLLSFGEWPEAAVVAGVCLGSWDKGDGTVAEVVEAEVEAAVEGGVVELFGHKAVAEGPVLVERLEPALVLKEGTRGVCFTGWTENVTLVGEPVLAGAGEGVAVCGGVRGEACFGTWL